MNVLFVTYDFPYPTNTGGKNRAFHLLKYTAKKVDIFLYSFVREDFNPEHIDVMKEIGIKDVKVFKRKRLKNLSNIAPTVLKASSIFKTLYFEKKILTDIQECIKTNAIDVVHFESSYTGYYIGKKLKKTRAKIVLGTENIEHSLYFDYARKYKNLLIRPFLFYQANRLKKEEEQMMKLADITTAITQEEASYIESVSKKKCVVVGNGIDITELRYQFRKKTNRNLLFVGNFSYFPNIDAMQFFYKEVFSLLPSTLTLTIVGKKGKEVLGFTDERIIFKEFVDNIEDEYRNADVLIFPVRIGGGTNFKVLEAMALGVPIVAYPQRLSGLGAVPGVQFLEAGDKSTYVEQINKLYADEALREELAQNGRKLVENNFTWEKISLALLKAWKEIAV